MQALSVRSHALVFVKSPPGHVSLTVVQFLLHTELLNYIIDSADAMFWIPIG